MSTPRMNAMLRRALRAPVWLYRCKCGWVLGHRFLLLIHNGRRTGLKRYTVLEIMEVRKHPSEFVVMSGFGPNADWLRNIQATPGYQIVVGSQHFTAAHRVLPVDEAVPVLASYERRSRLLAPIVRSVLSKLLGWRYDGSEPARRRAVAELPLIAFRPVQ